MSYATIKYNIYDYFSAESVLNGRRERKIGNNTWLIHDTDSICVKYHSTIIARFRVNGTATYNSGGWQTYTTKDRLNQLLPKPWRLYQKKHVWYLVYVVDGDWSNPIEWEDGVTLSTM